jgi:DNA-binding protein HU-beta
VRSVKRPQKAAGTSISYVQRDTGDAVLVLFSERYLIRRQIMNKPELIDAVAERTGMKKKDAATAVDAVLDTITDTLGRKEEVSLVGFGTFDVRERAERMGRNPRTGEQLTIPASTACVFRPGRKLKESAAM